MSGSTLGNILKIHSFGESHGDAVGVVIDGVPAGLSIDFDFIQKEMDRRRPGQSSITTTRNESDEFSIVSGLFEGQTTGHPIAILVPNKNQKSKDYSKLKEVYRPSHADFTYQQKYGLRDHRGGGRASARITAPWVAAGAIAKLLLKATSNISITSYVSRIHNIELNPNDELDFASIEQNIVRCPNKEKAEAMVAAIEQAKADGDSLGGLIHTRIANCPVGLGEPVFGKLNADLGKAMLSINACKGVQFGTGFDSAGMLGSEFNDEWEYRDGKASTTSNHSGGIQGGISNGEVIEFDAVFRPTSSISKKQKTVDHKGETVDLQIEGRHDPCVLPRAVPIVEAMSALVLADHFLMAKTNRLKDLT